MNHRTCRGMIITTRTDDSDDSHDSTRYDPDRTEGSILVWDGIYDRLRYYGNDVSHTLRGEMNLL